MHYKKKYIIFSMIISLLFIFTFQPISTLAEDSVNKNDLDSEIDKSGESIRDEMDRDGEELDTHDLKEIPEGKKKFYEAYKDEFDEMRENNMGGEIFVDLIEDFDYQGGQFVCGNFDVTCHIVNFMYVGGTSMANFILAPLKKLAIEPEKILNDPKLVNFQLHFNSFTFSLLAVFILFQIIKIYAFRMTNHADTINVMNEKIVKIGMASILLFSYTSFFKLIMTIQYRINYGIFSYLSNSKEATNDLILNLMLTPNGITFLILIIIFAVLLSVLFFQMTYTFALVALYYIVGPVAITTMVNDEYNMFNMWLRTIISRFITLALQGLCVILAFTFGSNIEWFIDQDIVLNAFQKIIALSFLIVGISIPSLLKDFGNSSGSGRGAMSAAQNVTRVVMRR